MKLSSLLLFLVLLIVGPSSCEAKCDPTECPYSCCDYFDACATSPSKCSTYTGSTIYCIPSYCSHGCCVGNYCGSARECDVGLGSTVYIVIIVVIVVFVILCALGLTIQHKRNQKRRQEYLRKRQEELRAHGIVDGVEIARNECLNYTSSAINSSIIEPGQPIVGSMAIGRGVDPTMNIMENQMYSFGNNPMVTTLQVGNQPNSIDTQPYPVHQGLAIDGLPPEHGNDPL